MQHFIIPIGAAMVDRTTPMMNMPAIFFIRFFDNHGLLQIVDRPNWWVMAVGQNDMLRRWLMDLTIRLSSRKKM